MKKLYSAILLGAAVAFGANADVKDVCGTYTMYARIFNNGFGTREQGAANTSTATIAVKEGNTVTIAGLLPSTSTYGADTNSSLAVVTGTYDDATKTITILPQVPMNADGTPYSSKWGENCRLQNHADNAAPMVLNFHNGVLEFAGNSLIHVQGWDYATDAKKGGTYSLIGWHMLVNNDLAWETVGTTTFEDKSFGGGKQIAIAPSTTWEVSISKVPGVEIYKVGKVFPGYAQAANDGFGYDWIFNAIDPSFIWMPFHNSGVAKNANETPGALWFGTYNTTAQMDRATALADSTVKANMPTIADKVITLPAKWCYYSYPADTYMPGTDWSCNGTEASTLNLNASASVEDITADKNAPVEYYNLQGVKVATPAKGQLLIRHQGSKATKVIL